MESRTDLFPQRLRHLREQRGISRRVLSELSGLSKNMVAVYENGETEPSLSALLALSDALDVSVDRLLGRE